MKMNRYLVQVRYYYHDNNNKGYGFFRKKIYADTEKESITKFKRLLNNKFTFSENFSTKLLGNINSECNK